MNRKHTSNLIAALIAAAASTLVQAGFLDTMVDKAKSLTDKTVSDTLHPSETEAATKPAAQKTETPAPPAASGSKYIEIDAIATARRPATPASIGLTRLRYDRSWPDEKTMLTLTEGVIYCQQNVIKPIGHWRGCLGEREYTGKPGAFNVRAVPVFAPDEVAGKNRKFVAQANRERLKPYLIEMAEHLPPEFGNTLGWRGTYDFDRQLLTVKITGMEKAEPWHLSHIPAHLRHMDVYKVPDRNFEGTVGEVYRMKPYIPEGMAGAVIALVFDRELSDGAVKIPPSKAEALFQKTSGNVISGTALVEFSVNKTEESAALATLEQVKILSAGNTADLQNPEPVMVIPASAFPKIEAPAPKPVKTAVKTASGKAPAAQPVVEKKATDPYLRAVTGKPFGPDVLGLRLGMTFDEADKLLRKHKEVMKVIDGKPPRPYTRATLYIFKPGDEYIGILGLKMPKGDRIATIDRTLYFDPDKSPSQTAIAASVEKKYGKPSYKYEVTGNFNRNWYTDADGEPTKKPGSETRACEYALTNSASSDAWKINGKVFRWEMPWKNKTYMGVSAAPGVGSHKDLEKDKPNECGPVVKVSYFDNSGMLTGPQLQIRIYDPAWIIADDKKLETKEKAGGAKDLEL